MFCKNFEYFIIILLSGKINSKTSPKMSIVSRMVWVTIRWHTMVHNSGVSFSLGFSFSRSFSQKVRVSIVSVGRVSIVSIVVGGTGGIVVRLVRWSKIWVRCTCFGLRLSHNSGNCESYEKLKRM